MLLNIKVFLQRLEVDAMKHKCNKFKQACESCVAER